MDITKSTETRSVPQETPATSSGLRADTIKLVEMGDASIETKGIVRGLEPGWIPMG